MGSSPIVPSGTTERLKSFWARPEGKTGILVILAAGGLALWGWGAIVGYIVSLLTDTVHMAILVAELLAIAWVLFSKRSHLIFRLLMRWLTGLVINIDPIGILKDHILQMRKRREKMGEQIAAVAGQIHYLEDIINKNKRDAEHSMGMAEQAKKMSQTQDQIQALRMQAQMRVQAGHAERLKESNVGYQGLLTKLQTVYDILSKWAIHIDFFIEDTQDQVNQAEVQYNAIRKASSAYKSAMSIITGNTDENDVYNETLEHLAEYAGEQLGQIDDFQRVAQNFMDKIDVQNGAADTEALAQLDKYEQKLLTPGGMTDFLQPGAQQSQAIPINRQSVAPTGTDDYGDLLK